MIYPRLPSVARIDETHSPTWGPELTKHLAPFLETRDLETLAAILRARPALLAHPFAWVQMLHLRRMLRAPDTAPCDAEKAHEALRGLVVAWAEGMLGPQRWKVTTSVRRRKGRPPVGGSEEDWQGLATLVDEASWWLHRLAAFRWKRLAADFREDAEDTIDVLSTRLREAWVAYLSEVSEQYVWFGEPDSRPASPSVPLPALIREGFATGSPKRYIALGLAGSLHNMTPHHVRHALKRAKEARLT